MLLKNSVERIQKAIGEEKMECLCLVWFLQEQKIF